MIWFLFGIVVLLLSYLYLIKPHGYWKNKGVPQTKPLFLLGDDWKNFFKIESTAKVIQDIYNKANGHRYYGFYQGLVPTLLVKDPDLLKQITVKDFEYFHDHRIVPAEDDPLWMKNLLTLKGQRWKEMRATLSPCFTSSKMRMIFGLMTECAEVFSKHFLSKSDEELKNIEMKDVFTRYANDVIASVAFGIRCDSLGEPDNKFYEMGKEATNFTSTRKSLIITTIVLLPKIAKFLKMKVFDNHVAAFFRNVVKKTLEVREKQGIVRPDMIHLLMEAQKNGMQYDEQNGQLDTGFATVQESDIGKPTKQMKFKITELDITAQGLIFFFAGFDSVTSVMGYMAHELAIKPEIQARLIKEIDETLESCDGKVTYETLLKMKYLDMVVSEALRIWPNFVSTDRVVTKPYTIEPVKPNEKPLHLDANDLILIPTYGLHHDPELFPDPEKFDPERFSDENKGNIKPYSYLPFGAGPRNCIGSRFALLEMKAVFFHLLSNFELVVTDKTEIPLQLHKKAFSMTAANGFWLGFKRRNKEKGSS